jgi:exportin-2 (importin alpha re-exporter)
MIQEPLLQLAQATDGLVDRNIANAAALVPFISALYEISEAFQSLNTVDLPEYFEDHIKEWMALFKKYLLFANNDVALVGTQVRVCV